MSENCGSIHPFASVCSIFRERNKEKKIWQSWPVILPAFNFRNRFAIEMQLMARRSKRVEAPAAIFCFSPRLPSALRRDVNFQNVDFQNVNFQNVDFLNDDFLNVDFQNVNFKDV
jgi:uncharacterized protein YjbI with pentapeptide repeats